MDADQVVSAAAPLRVAILCGSADQSVIDRFQQGWEVWGMNGAYPLPPQMFARRFNLHMWEHLKRDWSQGLRADIANAASLRPGVPLYTCDEWRNSEGKLVPPNQKLFPRDEINRGPGTPDYHAGSFDWLVAYAILLGAVEVTLHGVSLSWDSARDEPISARACLEYWIGIAEGRGIKVGLFQCDLMFQYHLVRSRSVYGYDDVVLMEERGIDRFDPRPIGWTPPKK